MRIRVLNNRSIGFGSGTIIHSTPEESYILTCAHIFKIDGRKQARPSEFPRKIMVDLFDGNLKGQQVHFLEAVAGTAVDYDFTRDVGLIRIRPGRRLPACRVVPTHWEPASRMQVMTVGCSEGRDATAWPTVISRPRIQNFLSGNPAYEAIECNEAPKQGRSGGGLFTDDGYIAGVCNFAEPQGNHGLYATPRSIYSLLDRNNLMALYAPVSRGSGTLVADRRAGTKPLRGGVAVARSQSPDHEEPAPRRNRINSEEISVPHPSLLGIAEPATTRVARSAPAASASAEVTRRTAWQPHPVDSGEARQRAKAEQTDLNLDPAADHDRFSAVRGDDFDREDDDAFKARSSSGGSTVSDGSSRWRAVKTGSGN